MNSLDPHQGQPIAVAGTPLHLARSAMAMLHGRGATAPDILSLAGEIAIPKFAYVAPQAAGSSWYPNRFSAPLASNEPWLTSALNAMASVLATIAAANTPIERTVLLGFSQGACLALEFAARYPNRYGGVIGLSGALIQHGNETRHYTGDLTGVSVFLGCSTTDPQVPSERVEQSARIFRELGSDVTLRLYPNMGHVVIPNEVQAITGMIAAVMKGGDA